MRHYKLRTYRPLLAIFVLVAFASSCQPEDAPAGRSSDGDGDGVPEISDLCPSTPPNVAVDAGGCRLGLASDTVLSRLPGFGGSDSSSLRHTGSVLPSPGDTTPPPGFVRMEVFFGTDRRPLDVTGTAAFYGKEIDSKLHFGSVVVSIPKRHAPGAVETPSLSCFGAGMDPAEHVALLEIHPLDRPVWATRLRSALENSREPEALVYIHGYKRSFERAARTAAQLAFDVNFPGVPLLYSWPSNDEMGDYTADYQATEETTLHLADFLNEVVEQTGAGLVHVIGHSLGNQALMNALEVISAARTDTLFENLILSAPDVSARVFVDQLAPRIIGTAARTTLYARSPDRALQISETLRESRRLGQAGDSIVVLEEMDTIDASKVDADFIGHGYTLTTKTAIDDLFMLLVNGHSPSKRNLDALSKGELVYWGLR